MPSKNCTRESVFEGAPSGGVCRRYKAKKAYYARINRIVEIDSLPFFEVGEHSELGAIEVTTKNAYVQVLCFFLEKSYFCHFVSLKALVWDLYEM